MTATVELPPTRALSTEDQKTVNTASSANARINIPLNVNRWIKLPLEQQELLTWFHQFALDREFTMAEAAAALNYDNSTIHRVLWGTYEGSWNNVCGSIKSYKRIEADRGTIQRQEFVENSITRMICGALKYALANNSIAIIMGESRMGKSTAARWWRDQNNHGRSVLVSAPAYGGVKGILRRIAEAVGVNKNLSAPQMYEAVIRAFNKNRILIVDEGIKLLPADHRSPPTQLEVLREIHDESKCGLAIISTGRFVGDLKRGEYMYEQFLGRVGMPVRLPREIKEADYQPIVRQYVANPGSKLMSAIHQIANEDGRLGILVETLKVASRIAAQEQKTDKPRITQEHVFKAIATRKEMMGETVYAKRD
jgi:DNA transposition AAA+ family ATPase